MESKNSLTVFLVTLFSILSYSAVSRADQYQGQWAVDCSKPISLNFKDKKTAILTVNQNQIYIEIKYKQIAGDAVDFFYVQPEELGMGGSEIDWDDISTSDKIGTFKVLGEKKANFSWLGFRDKKSGAHTLVKEADFATAKNEITLVRCD